MICRLGLVAESRFGITFRPMASTPFGCSFKGIQGITFEDSPNYINSTSGWMAKESSCGQSAAELNSRVNQDRFFHRPLESGIPQARHTNTAELRNTWKCAFGRRRASGWLP